MKAAEKEKGIKIMKNTKTNTITTNKEEKVMKHYAYEAPFEVKDKEGNKYELEIFNDEFADNPRSWDNVCSMVCWHGRYNLGDEHDYSAPEDFLRQIVSNTLSADEIVNYVKFEDENNDVKLEYNRSTHEWELIEIYNGREYINETFTSQEIKESNMVTEYILGYLSISSLKELTDRNHVILPLFLYDHSGISISCDNDYPYNDQWDAGQVGWIYVSKDTIFKETFNPTEESWRDIALRLLRSEVETYDLYLRNEVYGYTLKHKVIQKELCPHCGEIIKEFEDIEEIETVSGFYGDCLEENGILDNIDMTIVED